MSYLCEREIQLTYHHEVGYLSQHCKFWIWLFAPKILESIVEV